MSDEDEGSIEEVMLELADSIEMAATDLQSGKVESAGYELQNIAWHIQESVEVPDND